MAADSFERAYAALLRLYPAEFYAEYGEPMRLHFRDQLRDARQAGGGAVIGLLFRALWDVLRSSAAERAAARRPAASYQPVGWGRVAAALLPGVLVLVAMVTVRTSAETPYPAFAVALLLSAAYFGVGWRYERRVGVWMLPITGYLVAFLVSDGILLFLLYLTQRGGQPGSGPMLGIVGALVAAVAGFSLLYGLVLLARRSIWRAGLAVLLFVGPQMLSIWLVWSTSQNMTLQLLMQWHWLYLVPLAVGFWFARRFGDRAVLLVAVVVTQLTLFFFEPGGGNVWIEPWRWLYPLLAQAVALVLVPLLVLRLRHPLTRAAGVLLPVAGLLGLGVGLLVYQQWNAESLRFASAEVMLHIGWLAFALVLYGGVQREAAPTVAPVDLLPTGGTL